MEKLICLVFQNINFIFQNMFVCSDTKFWSYEFRFIWMLSSLPTCLALRVPEWKGGLNVAWKRSPSTTYCESYYLWKNWTKKVHLNRILRISWSASLILVLYLSCIAIVAPVHPSGRLLILWKRFFCVNLLIYICPRTLLPTWRSICMIPALSPVSP